MDNSATSLTIMPISLEDHQLPAGWGPWDLPSGWRLEPHGGPDGTPALRLHRTDAAEYLNARFPIPLTPGERYCISAQMFLESSATIGVSAHVNIEFFDADDRYLGSSSLAPVTTADSWVEGTAEFTVPEFTAVCRLMFYLNAGVTGAAKFAMPAIGPAAFRWTAYPLTPVRDVLFANGGMVTFGFFSLGTPRLPAAQHREWSCQVQVQTTEAIFLSAMTPVQHHRFAVEIAPLPAGPATITVNLFDASGKPFDTLSFPVDILEDSLSNETSTRLDRRGRTLIDGRPYLPLGLYMGLVERDELEEIAQSPFNCLMPYGSMFLKFQDSAQEGVAAVREVLDACQVHGISVIFSMAGLYDDAPHSPGEYLGETTAAAAAATAVRAFRDHPAVLAWYVNDEQPVECIPRLLERRRLVRGLDRDHPIYAVMCQAPELPLYTGIVDVYGIDPYPIVDPACNHIRISRYAHDMAELAVHTEDGAALWTVVQAHNIGAYDHRAKQDPVYYREAYRDPSFDEMLALSLLALIRGAKGLLYYSYPDLAHPEHDAQARERRWDALQRVGRIVRNLEHYLLSDLDAPAINMQVTAGEVEARAFRDEQGRECVLIVSIGPGTGQADLTLSAGVQWISLLGRTTSSIENTYHFVGFDACADVLMKVNHFILWEDKSYG